MTLQSNGHDLLQLPYHWTDGTSRTHLALSSSGGVPKLSVVDFRNDILAVFTANKEGYLVKVEPNEWDQKLLDAMASVDDNGPWFEQRIYWILRGPVILFLLVLSAIGLFYPKRLRNESDHRKQVDSKTV